MTNDAGVRVLRETCTRILQILISFYVPFDRP